MKREHTQRIVFVFCCYFTFIFMKEVLAKTSSGTSLSMIQDLLERKMEDSREEFSSRRCACGEETLALSSRIIGGEDVIAASKYPWMVALMVKTGITKHRFFCGGTLISKQYVLTAAHCIDYNIDNMNNTSSLRLIFGTQRIPVISQGLKGSKIIMHPGYGRHTMENDIALIKIKKPVRFTESIRPICLWLEKNAMQASTVVITGWGHINRKVPYPQEYFFQHAHDLFVEQTGVETKILQEATVTVVPNDICREKYKGYLAITDSMMCAGGKEKAGCHGDSGGPLLTSYKGKWYQVGITSFTIGCGTERFPTGYLRVSHYLDWIYNNTRGARPCQLGK